MLTVVGSSGVTFLGWVTAEGAAHDLGEPMDDVKWHHYGTGTNTKRGVSCNPAS